MRHGGCSQSLYFCLYTDHFPAQQRPHAPLCSALGVDAHLTQLATGAACNCSINCFWCARGLRLAFPCSFVASYSCEAPIAGQQRNKGKIVHKDTKQKAITDLLRKYCFLYTKATPAVFKAIHESLNFENNHYGCHKFILFTVLWECLCPELCFRDPLVRTSSPQFG